MTKHILSAIIGALVCGVTIFAIFFFRENPFRQGAIIIKGPGGISIAFNVSNSDDLTGLLLEALNNEKTTTMMTHSLLSIIKGLKPGSYLVQQLCGLVDRREPPFLAKSIPVKLVYDPNMPLGIAAACENSQFLSQNIKIYPIDDNGGGIPTSAEGFYVDSEYAVSCSENGEILRVNFEKIDEFQQRQVMAKRTY
jgi:hypothetical protein